MKKHLHQWTVVWHECGRWIYRCPCGQLGYGVPGDWPAGFLGPLRGGNGAS